MLGVTILFFEYWYYWLLLNRLIIWWMRMHINFQSMHLKKADNMFMHVAMDECCFWIFVIYLKFTNVIKSASVKLSGVLCFCNVCAELMLFNYWKPFLIGPHWPRLTYETVLVRIDVSQMQWMQVSTWFTVWIEYCVDWCSAYRYWVYSCFGEIKWFFHRSTIVKSISYESLEWIDEATKALSLYVGLYNLFSFIVELSTGNTGMFTIYCTQGPVYGEIFTEHVYGLRGRSTETWQWIAGKFSECSRHPRNDTKLRPRITSQESPTVIPSISINKTSSGSSWKAARTNVHWSSQTHPAGTSCTTS